MLKISNRLVAGLILGASLVSLANSVSAEGNCPTGSTCKCVPTKFTKCKADAQGNQYDCQQHTGETCTVISGPGSGKAIVVQPNTTSIPPSRVAPRSPTSGVAR